MITRTSILLATAITAVATTQGIAASPGKEREMRGFNTCVNAAEAADLTGVTTKRTYFLRETEDRNVFYVNVLGWEESDWVAKRVRCETSPNGRTLLSANWQTAATQRTSSRSCGSLIVLQKHNE